MSAPLRWKDSGDGPAGARELLSQAEATRALRGEEKARTAARIGAIAAAPVAAGAWLWIAGVAAAATAALGTVVAVHVAHVRDGRTRELALPPAQVAPAVDAVDAPASSSAADAPSAADASDVPAPVATVTTASPSAPASAVVRPRASSVSVSSAPSGVDRSSPEDALVRETAMLEQARSLLAADPAAALKILAQHRTEFPRGQLAVEAELLTVDALERLGRNAQARRRGEALLSRVRGTIYQARVERLLAGLPR